MGQTMKQWALDYAQEGLAVFAVLPKMKEPACKNGCKAATTDPMEIAEFWDLPGKENCNIGIATGAPSGGIVVIDIDVDEDAGKDGYANLREWENEHGELPETWTAITGRGGYHLYYRVKGSARNTVNAALSIDIRGDGGYVLAPPSIHPNGTPYVWENDPEDFELADADENVLAFIEHVRGKRSGKKLKVNPKQSKGGRNNGLFKMGASMRSQGNDDHAVACAMRTYNEGLPEPLPEAEVERTIQSVLTYEPGNSAVLKADGKPKPQWRGKNNKLLHEVFADWLIESRHVKLLDGVPAAYDGRVYDTGVQAVQKAMVETDRSIKKLERGEVMSYLMFSAPKESTAAPNYICFNNGLFDLDNGTLSSFTPSVNVTNLIPHDYNPNADTSEVELFLYNLANGSEATMQNLMELVGYCLYRSCEVRFVPILTGVGSNGKSTFINLMRFVLGDSNVSSLDLETIGQRFMASHLAGKLANLGDDINPEVRDKSVLSVFKKIATGDKVFTDVKGMDGFEFRPYATLVFSCNGCPVFGESSDGLMQRIFPIPFDADFSASNPDSANVPNMERVMRTEENAQAFIILGLKALKEMLKRGEPTRNKAADKEKQRVLTMSDSCRMWLDEMELNKLNLEGAAINDLYANYKSWSEDAGMKPLSRRRFTVAVCDAFGFFSKPSRIETANGGGYERVFAKVKK